MPTPSVAFDANPTSVPVRTQDPRPLDGGMLSGSASPVLPHVSSGQPGRLNLSRSPSDLPRELNDKERGP